MRTKMKRFFILLATIFLAATCAFPTFGMGASKVYAQENADTASTSAETSTESLEYNTVEELKKAPIGAALTGSVFPDILNEMGFESEQQLYNSVADMALAVENNKIDYFVSDEPVAHYYISAYDDLAVLPELLMQEDYYYILPLDHTDLQEEFNTWLSQAKADGVLDELSETWIQGEGEQEPLDLDALSGEKGTLNIGASMASFPGAYYLDNKPAGYNLAVVYRFCSDCGYGMKILDTNIDAMISSIVTGKVDMFAEFVSYTDERAEKVLFTDPTYSGGVAAVVRKTGAGAAANSKASAGTLEYNSVEELKKAPSGAMMTGSIFPDVLDEMGFESEQQLYNSEADMALAVENHKTDFFVADEPIAHYYITAYDDLAVLPELLMQEDYYYIMPMERADLQQEFNTWLSQAKADGVPDELYTIWIQGDGEQEPLDLDALSGEKGVLRIGANMAKFPGSYYLNNKPAGYNLALVYQFCKDCGYGMEVADTNTDAMISSVVTGKVDMFANFVSYTDERAEKVLFTDPTYSGGIAAVVRMTGGAGAAGSSNEGFLSGLKESFYKSFIEEQRYILVLQGLGITLLITVFGFLLANVVGAIFCYFAMSRNHFLNAVARVFDWLMQGTPMVVILMILYYVVLGKTSISGIWVAVIGFGLNTGAYLAQTFKGAIQGVNYGQTEASLMLGLTKKQAFFGIVMPQAIRRMMSSYFSQIISLMKGTAVVGYIAVTDLTKVGDIIRSSTYEAFFPLLSIAAIYLIITTIILRLLRFVQKKLSKKQPPKAAQGGK